jgi:endonuclease G
MPNGTNATSGIAVAALPLAIGLGIAALGGGDVSPGPLPAATFDSLSPADQALVTEHVFGGLPSADPLHVRKGYIGSYDLQNRVPRWVAYHVSPGYLNPPPREGRFKTFRVDPDIDNPVRDADYVGLQASRGYARGHLAPYAVMGGDRDGNGVLARDDPDDPDAQTVFQANFMSNIAPQHQAAFNGAGAVWFKLERFVQDDVVRARSIDAWVFSGSIFGLGQPEKVGPDADIGVPPMFFSIVIRQPEAPDTELPRVLAFLFPHSRVRHGDLEDYLVSIDVVEALTGLDFFNEFGEEVQRALEDTDTFENWDGF